MLGGHLYELIIVLVIALVIFGPKRLPELGSSLGKGIREFRKATNELQDSIKTETTTEALPGERRTYTATEYTTPTHTTTTEYVASQEAPRQGAPVHVENEAPRV